jgi:CheY-like chemotaxis protein
MTQVTCWSFHRKFNMAVTMTLTSLLVCSDVPTIQILRRILEDLGIKVESCGDLSVAAARIEERHFDALLLDCEGRPAAAELIAQARKSETNKSSVAIAIVGPNDTSGDISTQGANFILYKPISRERVANSMHAACDLMRYERRIQPRVPVEATTSITYADKEDVPAALVDLSDDGVAIRSKNKLPPYSKVYFHFVLPGNTSPVRLSGEVMWQDSSGRVGIRFAQVPKTSRRLMNEWLQAQVSASAPGSESQATKTDDDPTLRLSAGLGMLSVTAADRRNISRHPCCLGVEVYRAESSVASRCTLTDISAGGCYIKTAETFPSGTELQLVVRTEEIKLRIDGTVQSMHPGFGMGVRFTLGAEELKQKVQQLIECVQSASQSPESI